MDITHITCTKKLSFPKGKDVINNYTSGKATPQRISSVVTDSVTVVLADDVSPLTLQEGSFCEGPDAISDVEGGLSPLSLPGSREPYTRINT